MIYFDNAATTPLKKEVLDKMLPYLTDSFYNPSSVYSTAQQIRSDVEQARADVATALGALPQEIYFTGSGTEADNWAIKSAARTMKQKKNRTKIIISCIEHHAILHSAEVMQKEGFTVVKIPVDGCGNLNKQALSEQLDENTAICSIIMANNEIGTIQDIKSLALMAKEKGVIFHTDAVQAVGSIAVDVKELGVDMLSLSAHKFYGPKGVGVLFIKKGTPLPGFIDGGGQERLKRAGTENVAGIIGLAEALKIAVAGIEKNYSYVSALRDRLESALSEIPKIRVNGDKDNRLPGNLNISFEGIEGEGILLLLDMQGIAASSGSACASGSLEPSHVLMSLGMTHGIAQGTVRFSLSHTNTEQEVDKAATIIKNAVSRLREMSPVWQG